MFLAALAAAALGTGVRLPTALAASGVDPSAVAARDADRQPTQWGMSLPGIMTTFNPSGRQRALTFDACDDSLLNTLERNAVPALLSCVRSGSTRTPAGPSNSPRIHCSRLETTARGTFHCR